MQTNNTVGLQYIEHNTTKTIDKKQYNKHKTVQTKQYKYYNTNYTMQTIKDTQ